jgi:hypothetical protein
MIYLTSPAIANRWNGSKLNAYAKHCRASGHCSETSECTKKERGLFAQARGLALKAWSEGCLVRKKAREVLAARFMNTYPHRPAISLVTEKEPGPGRPKGSKNQAASRTGAAPGDAMEVDSLAPERPSAKRPRQATLSFGVAE